MVELAYDGSLNGDWVARYAVRFAAQAPERRLRLLHVHEGHVADAVRLGIDRIGAECARLGVALDPVLHRRGAASVAECLLALVPAGRGTMLVAGTRARPRNIAFLAGTVSARLLAAGRFPVVAIRVVQPGILGQPGDVLLPLSGHPRGAAFALPLLRLLGSDLLRLHVLLVREVSRLRFRLLGPASAERLLAAGRAYLADVEAQLRRGLVPLPGALDTSAIVSDDAAKEIPVFAARLHARLICLGASERRLPERLVYGNPIEQVLRIAPCDVAVYRSVE
jgi:nucleotide-binding universal stress UspA family protein